MNKWQGYIVERGARRDVETILKNAICHKCYEYSIHFILTKKNKVAIKFKYPEFKEKLYS